MGHHSSGYFGKFKRGEYGRFSPEAGKTVMAHRYAYEHEHGAIPVGLQLDHLCRVTLCVNPNHLEIVDQAENNRRSVSPSSLNMKKDRCKRGHLFTEETTYRNADKRICVPCRRLHSRNYVAKHREVCLEKLRSYYRRRKKVMP